MSLVRLFLDANVLFSAAYSPKGRAATLVDLAASGRCVLLASPHVLAEAQHNLASKHPEAVRVLEEKILPSVTLVAEATPDAVRAGLELDLPLKDAPVLGAASMADADYLVTGDYRHFGHLMGGNAGGVEVITPAQALARVIPSD